MRKLRTSTQNIFVFAKENYLKNKLFSLTNSSKNFATKRNENFDDVYIDQSWRVKSSIKPKTISDIKKIQNFVKTSNANGSLEESLYRSAKKNEEFNIFFKEFKEKNKGKWESIINGMDVDDNLLTKETDQDKKEEIEMMEEFERRRKFKTVYESLEENEELQEKQKEELTRKNPNQQSSEGDEKLEEVLKPDLESGETYDSKKFTLIFLDAGMVCNMTRLNRVYERRVLLYMGNKEGLISYGIGRGALYQEAFTQAYKELRKNLIAIPIDFKFTVPSDLNARFNDFRIYIRSQYEPRMWGNPILCLMLRYAGMYHGYFVVKSRLKEPYAMVFAFFKAVTRNKTPEQVCEVFGTKSYRQYIGRPKRYEYTLLDGQNA